MTDNLEFIRIVGAQYEYIYYPIDAEPKKIYSTTPLDIYQVRKQYEKTK